jgi:hypothetical protein
MKEFGVAVAWVNEKQRDEFLAAWSLGVIPPWLFLQQDEHREGGAMTKNKAMKRAIDSGAEVIVSLDDDCYPFISGQTLEEFCRQHIEALEPKPVEMFEVVTSPPSRGTPYRDLCMVMPVAASMGFWNINGDYCAVRQLAYGENTPMTFERKTVFGKYFPLCGMNYAFRPKEWEPWYFMMEGVGRFDDIWMGFLWQKEAYRRGHCFNLAGPMVNHVRQSNMWANLMNESQRLLSNETAWKHIAESTETSYQGLKDLLTKQP